MLLPSCSTVAILDLQFSLTLTNVSRKEPKFQIFEEAPKQQVVAPIPQPKVVQSEVVKPKEEIIQEIIQPQQKVEDKIEIIQSVTPKIEPTVETKPDINKEVAKITEHKALPEPEQKPKSTTLDDDFDIIGNIQTINYNSNDVYVIFVANEYSSKIIIV